MKPLHTLLLTTLIALATACRAEDDFSEKLSTEKSPPARGGPHGGFSDIVKKVTPSVVSIHTSQRVALRSQMPNLGFFDDPFFKHFFEDRFPSPGFPHIPDNSLPAPMVHGLGSGVIATSDGYIITNNHVIDGSDEVKIRLPGNGKDFTATVVGRDPATDLAVIKIDASDLLAASFGDSSRMMVGDIVLAVGSPFGLNQTVTAGIISGLGRADLRITGYEDFIQTDASINPGNSGGALINNRGHVIGINTAIMSRGGGNVGVGFAIPINMVIEIADQLVDRGEIERGYLGVMLSPLTEDLAKGFGVEARGVLVNEVMDGTPAEKAGLRPGDIIRAYGNDEVDEVSKLRLKVARTVPGTGKELSILRDGKPQTVKVIIGKLPANTAASIQPRKPDSSLIEGLVIVDLDASNRELFNVPASSRGALVTEVDSTSLAAAVGLAPGDLIVEVNRREVGSVKEALEAKGSAREGVLLLRVVNEQGSRFVAIQINEP